MIDYIKGFEFNSTLGILLYWLPMVFCSYGYLLRTFRHYQEDKKKREEVGSFYYSPQDKLGTLIGRGLVSILPVGNIMAAVFDLSPEVFGRFFERLERVFNTPLVPDSDDYKAKRKAPTKEANSE